MRILGGLCCVTCHSPAVLYMLNLLYLVTEACQLPVCAAIASRCVAMLMTYCVLLSCAAVVLHYHWLAEHASC